MNAWVAFIGGLISFASPCVLPLIPTYIVYLTGSSLAELGEEEGKRAITPVMANALSFVAGFSFVFMGFGATASLVGRLLLEHQILLRKVSGVMIILFGLYMTEIIKLAPLYREVRPHLPRGTPGPINSLLVGMAFSAGWTPCVGPVLGSILALASNSADLFRGVYLLGLYSLGLGFPFLLTAIFMGWSLRAIRQLNVYLQTIRTVAGLVMIIGGWLIYNGSFNNLFL